MNSFLPALEGLTGANTALTNVGTGLGTSSQTTDLPTLIGNIISVGLGFMGVLLVVMIVYAGFIYATSQGDDAKIKSAKKMISSSIVGLVLVVAAYAIASYVISAISTAVAK